jgi:SAM-dependent methyltransferase
MTRSPLTTYLTLCTEFYDLEQHPYDAQALEFYMHCARTAQGNILEPMCGTGRFLIPMLQAGLAVEGFDASTHMLQALRQKYATINNNLPPVWEQFVQDFSPDTEYNLIFVPYGSWGLMQDIEDSKKSLKIMYNALAVGGKFIVDIETVASAPKSLNTWHRGISTRKDGSCIALNTYPTYNPGTQIFKSICRYESIVKNSIEALETEDFYMYLYQFDEFEKYLQAAGFTDIKKYQDYNKTPATDARAPLIIYECTK